eukprot:gb/GECG01012094.1/.p1 GENE.gb/GECG01012094.1/~~gb/GECG01012094.1/.p1  ORF type:complete len:132 (+),score=26.35 gb/GECG01012094.1/:1-396(+)
MLLLQVTRNTLAKFVQEDLTGKNFMLQKEFSLTHNTLVETADDLQDIPGIGSANEDLLQKEGISTPKQLLGKFLLLKDPELSTQEHCDSFYQWLIDEVGIRAHATTIVRSIGLKVSILIAGVYSEDEDEDE